MPRLAANLSMMYAEHAFLDRFGARPIWPNMSEVGKGPNQSICELPRITAVVAAWATPASSRQDRNQGACSFMGRASSERPADPRPWTIFEPTY